MAWKHRLLPLVALALLALAGCAGQQLTTVRTQNVQHTQNVTSAPAAPPHGTIVALGDSLTAGYGVLANESYPAQLERMLHEHGYNYTVINMGKSGDTSAGALARIDDVVAQKPDIVILVIGANDALRMADPNATKQTIGEIIARLQQENVTVVLAGNPQVTVQGWEYPGDFTRIYGELAKQYNLTYNPFFLKGVAGDPELNLNDRVHPNALGYSIIARNMYQYVVQTVRKQQSGQNK